MKRKSLLTLTALLTTAAFTALSLSACAESEETETLPKGWEITDTDGNVDYLTATDGSNVFETDSDYTVPAYSSADYESSETVAVVRGALFTDFGEEYNENRELKFTEKDSLSVLVVPVYHVFPKEDAIYRLAVTVGNETMRVDLPEDFDSWATGEPNSLEISSDRAMWIHIPGTLFRSAEQGEVHFALEAESQGRTWRTEPLESDVYRYHLDGKKTVFSPIQPSQPSHAKLTPLGVIFHTNVILLLPPLLWIAAIVLAVLAACKQRFRLLWWPSGLLAFAALYCGLSMAYYDSLPVNEPFDNLGGFIVSFFDMLISLGAIPVLIGVSGLIYLIIHVVRSKRLDRKAKVQSEP